MYDWANSVYALIITTAIFPIFYEKTTSEEVVFFGKTFVNTELYSYVISFSFMLLVVLSPILSGMADYSGNKKKYLQFFCYLGAFSCISLYFFDAEHALELSMLPVLLASIGFSGSLVFYNAYLPEIVTPDLQDNVAVGKSNNKALASTGGANTVASTGNVGGTTANATLSASQLAPHSHPYQKANANQPGNNGSPKGGSSIPANTEIQDLVRVTNIT